MDRETDLITVNRDVRVIELNNETNSVEFPMPDPAATDPEVNEFKLQHFVKKKDDAGEHSEVMNTTKLMIRKKNQFNLTDPFGRIVEQEEESKRKAIKKPEWGSAMDDELASHRHNHKWELVPPPEGH